MDIDRFVAWLEASGAAEGTLRIRRGYVERYLKALQSAGRDVTTATVSDVAAFLSSNKDWKPATRASVRSSVSSLHQWLIVEGIRSDNPVSGVKAVRVPPGSPKLVSEDVFHDALRAARTDKRALLALMLAGYAGLRRNEIATLHTDDVTDRGLRITGKGGRTRMVPIHPVLRPILDRECETPGWLFPGRDGHVSARTINRVVNTYLPEGFSTHALRHRFATMVHNGSHDLRSVQELLGHSSLATTQRYVWVSHDDLTMAVGSINVGEDVFG